MYKIAVITGTRAEYGLLRPVLKKLEEEKEIELSVLVTGSHLAANLGNTVDEIVQDGFKIDAKFDILALDAPCGRAGTAVRTGFALGMFLQWFGQEKNRPQAALLLGDRYEAFAAGQAAALLGIPLVHISGGDVTQGADDDWFRHCLSKMAKLHFPSCEVYKNRLIKMGEEPWRVFNVGGLGDENIRTMKLFAKEELLQKLQMPTDMPFALVSLHPETVGNLNPKNQAKILLNALKKRPNLFYLFSAANADAGGEELNDAFKRFCKTHKSAKFVPSLGAQNYLSAMKHAALIVGNSSSGVVESPSFALPAIDIGDRQKGREDAENIIHCLYNETSIISALDAALSSNFAKTAAKTKSPYSAGNTSGKIVSILLQFLKEKMLEKPKVFFDAEDGKCNF